jgi:hypothetical protein
MARAAVALHIGGQVLRTLSRVQSEVINVGGLSRTPNIVLRERNFCTLTQTSMGTPLKHFSSSQHKMHQALNLEYKLGFRQFGRSTSSNSYKAWAGFHAQALKPLAAPGIPGHAPALDCWLSRQMHPRLLRQTQRRSFVCVRSPVRCVGYLREFACIHAVPEHTGAE